MKKYLITLLLMSVAGLTQTVKAQDLSAYDGSEENPFRIETVEQFCSLIKYMTPSQMNYVVLENDLDMNEVTEWIPINCDQAVAVEVRRGNDSTGELLYFSNMFSFEVPSSVSLSGNSLWAVQYDGARIKIQ